MSVCVHACTYLCGCSMRARRLCWNFWAWSHRGCVTHHVVLRTAFWASAIAASALTAGPFSQPFHNHFFEQGLPSFMIKKKEAEVAVLAN